MRIELAPRRRATISLTALIDVVFILLVFFMLASNFAQVRTIGVQIPAEAGGGSSDQTAIVVQVEPDGRVAVDGAPIGSDRLAEHVRSVAAGRPVLVRPAEETRLQALVSVLDRLAGIPNVTLARP